MAKPQMVTVPIIMKFSPPCHPAIVLAGTISYLFFSHISEIGPDHVVPSVIQATPPVVLTRDQEQVV